MGHRQRSDGSGLQDYWRAAEGLRDALGRTWGCGARRASRFVRQQSKAMGWLLESALPRRRVNSTQGTDAHPRDTVHSSFAPSAFSRWYNVRKNASEVMP